MSLQHTLSDRRSQGIPKISSRRNGGTTMKTEEHKCLVTALCLRGNKDARKWFMHCKIDYLNQPKKSEFRK